MPTTDRTGPLDYLVQADGSISLNKAGVAVAALTEARRWARLQLAAASVGAALANVVRDDGEALESFTLRVSRSAEFDDNGRSYDSFNLTVEAVRIQAGAVWPAWARDADNEPDDEWAADQLADRIEDAVDASDVFAVFFEATDVVAGDDADVVTVDVPCDRIRELVRVRPISGRKAFAAMFPAVSTEIGLNEVDRLPLAGASWATQFGELVESFLNDPVLGPHVRSEVRRLSHLI